MKKLILALAIGAGALAESPNIFWNDHLGGIDSPQYSGLSQINKTNVNRLGVAYWENKDRSDRRILFTAGDQLQALDARTGNVVQSFGDNGKVNLKNGLGRDPDTLRRVQSGDPGRVFENLVILGSAPG